MKKWLIILFVIALLGSATVWRIYLIANRKPAESIDTIQERSGLPVRVFEVLQEDVENTISISGTIKPFKEIQVAPKITEKIITLHVTTGQTVKQDQLLVTLDDAVSKLHLAQAMGRLAEAREYLRQLQNGFRTEEIDLARTQMEQAKAQFDLQKLELERQKQLYQEEATPLQRLQEVEAGFNSAKANVEGTTANYEMMQAGPREEEINIAETRVELAEVAVKQAQENLDDHYLKAPFAGETCLQLLEAGDIAEMNAPIFRLIDIQQVYLDLDVSELYVPKLSIGQSVKINVDARPEEAFTGTIAEINPVANPTDRSYIARILIENQSRKLLPGMFARAKIALGLVLDVLLVPEDALKKDLDQYYALTVDTNNTVQKKNVTIGSKYEKMVQVIEGLSAGEKVITLSVNIEPGSVVTIEP
jgi:multidrug efflux pump subunit AcrA (membrane-fusion protein)